MSCDPNKKRKNYFFYGIWKLFFLLFSSFPLLFLHVTSSCFQTHILSTYLLLSWFHLLSCDDDLSACQHLPFVSFMPSIALTLLMIISLTIYSVFLSTPTFCSLDYIRCTGLCRKLRVYLICVFAYWHLPFSTGQSGGLLHCLVSVGTFLRYTLIALSFLWFEPASTPTLVKRTTICFAERFLCYSCLMKCPYRYMSLRPLTRWFSVLPTVQTRQFFFISSVIWTRDLFFETQHSTNCASQTAVLMCGIIFVYMLKLIDVFPLKKKKKEK